MSQFLDMTSLCLLWIFCVVTISPKSFRCVLAPSYRNTALKTMLVEAHLRARHLVELRRLEIAERVVGRRDEVGARRLGDVQETRVALRDERAAEPLVLRQHPEIHVRSDETNRAGVVSR